MDVEFWGVRGSLPTPISPEQIKSKIVAVVQKITIDDIVSTDSREKFLSTLPFWQFGTIGGNTACVSIINKNKERFILDAGTGIRLLGKKLANSKEKKVYHLFFSHFHWDHIQGLPFFDPIYNPESEFHFYAADEHCIDYLKQQMELPYYPVQMDKACTKKMFFHTISENKPFNIEGTTINLIRMSHPGNSYSFSFEEDGKKVIYATDVELQSKDYIDNRLATFFCNSDLLILDAQYTVEEAAIKENWGHSAFCNAIDCAMNWKTNSLYLFHHDPMYDDKKISTIIKAAKWYAECKQNNNTMKIRVATEGECIKI